MSDYYELLGLSRTATSEEITKAYRKKARETHPDINPGDPDAKKKFQEVQAAYDTLGDPVKKSMYDGGGAPNMHFRRRGRRSEPAHGGPTFEDVVNEFFGGSSFKGRNVQARVEIDFNEAITGVTKHIKVKTRKRCTGCAGQGFTGFSPCATCGGNGFQKTYDAPFEMQVACSACGGTGKASVVRCGDCAGSGCLPGFYEKELSVTIPAGIDSGMQVRIVGQGEESLRGGNNGDVLIFVLVKDHPIFTREGLHLNVEIPVSYTQVVLGGEVEIPTINQGILKVKIPPGSQSHTKFRIKGKGIPDGRGGAGDLIATIKIETPKTLNDDYKQVLDQLAALEASNVTPRREQWVKKVGAAGK